MKTKRQNFTDRQKADIFVRDRATCTFSGKNLWLLDYGAAPSSPDWADHIIPASKGGEAELDNGICSSWIYNNMKRNGTGCPYLFYQGRPTQDFFTFYGTVSEQVAQQLSRLSALHWSDWYFNRAVFHIHVAAAQVDECRADGKPFSRDTDYWAKAASKCLKTWARCCSETTCFQSRGLAPASPSFDQRLLLSISEESTIHEIKDVISEIAPYVKGSQRAMELLALVTTKKEARQFLREVKRNPFVVPQIKQAVQTNVDRLFLLTKA